MVKIQRWREHIQFLPQTFFFLLSPFFLSSRWSSSQCFRGSITFSNRRASMLTTTESWTLPFLASKVTLPTTNKTHMYWVSKSFYLPLNMDTLDLLVIIKEKFNLFLFTYLSCFYTLFGTQNKMFSKGGD